MRKSTLFILMLAVGAALTALMFIHAHVEGRAGAATLQLQAGIAGEFGLTDLCLSTEANYTRHLSQADLHTPFADGPAALEHFPSGSLIMPPATLRKINAQVD